MLYDIDEEGIVHFDDGMQVFCMKAYPQLWIE